MHPALANIVYQEACRAYGLEQPPQNPPSPRRPESAGQATKQEEAHVHHQA